MATPRLSLRPMLPTDLDDLHKIFSDLRVMASFNAEPFNREQMTRWLQRNLDHQSQYGYWLYSVILNSNRTLIGDCGLEQMSIDDTDVAELGYDFRSDYWNQGFATEAATAVRDYAFHQLRLPRLISLVRIGNLASRRVAEKIGMQRISEITRHDIRYWKFGIENRL